MYKHTSLNEIKVLELIPGFHGRFVHTDEMTLAYWTIEEGSELPEHHHFHKQIAQVIEGEFELTVDGVPHRMGPGDVLEIGGDVPHSGRALTDCVIHDIFLPVREDYRV